jgi:GTP-binding protein Era
MDTKCGYVSIIGLPNAGKSTLLNLLLGQKLSITTNKPQTTRKKILGILSEEEYQIIFQDTPGILNPEYLLQKRMLEFVQQAVKDADVILLLVDIDSDPEGEKTFADETVKKVLQNKQWKKVLVINKIDLSSQDAVNRLSARFEKESVFERIIPVSALLGFNADSVLNTLLELLPVHPKYYPEDYISDAPEKFYVSEIIREKIFEQYKEEIPYSTEVIIEQFKEQEGRKDVINASIIVERESQKPIIIGKRGEALKKLGQSARIEIEDFLERPVYLEIRVKVKEKWRSDPRMLNNFGYQADDE